jgi:hypothetical protein
MGFKSMKKMETTEPSVDEVGKGMKSGGKPKMAMGGAPMGKAPMGGALSAIAAQNARKRPTTPAEMAAMRPRGASMMKSAALSRPAPGIPAQAMGRVKNGGAMKKVEKEIRNEKEELHRVDEKLNRHEAKAASKAHKGLKTGGVPGYKTGGLIQKFATGGVVDGAAGYKDGGHCAMKSGGSAGFKAVKKGGCW